MKFSLPHPEVKHLTGRAAFGTALRKPLPDLQQLFKESEKVNPLLAVEKPDIDQGNLMNRKPKLRGMFDLLVKSKQDLMKLNIAWLKKITTEATLRERMTFFWHGHFACRTLIPYFAQQQNNILRASALGSFRDLLLNVSKDPAMLQFLNNQQNRKDHPNENFAREVMELFTLGRGNYSELDVKEAARAFTGWGFNARGEYQFRQKQHDFSSKSFRGKSKNFTGEDILESILDDKKTSAFITRKLYRFFISETNINPSVVDEWSDSFYRSGYDIKKLLNTMFDSKEFSDAANIGNRVKSPVELLAGIMLHTGGTFENEQNIVFLERALGQILFYPPNVSGWTSGKGWIDSTSLTFRVSLPMLLFGGAETDFEASDDGDANGLGKEDVRRRRLQCNVDWKKIADHFTKTSSEETINDIETFLLARPTSSENRKYILRIASAAPEGADFTKKAFIGYMSLPEYQLC